MKGKKMLGVLINLYGSWQTRHEAKSARKSTINELSRLSDFDLNDIGISRGDIRHIAQKHYKDIMEETRDKKELVGYANTNLKGWV
jgi:uncharacterized protein YjiS (DUF1127 family)